MKKYLFSIFITVFVCSNASAACVANAKVYTSCKSGYFLDWRGLCTQCPDNGTSADKNTGATAEVCYLPAGTTATDDTGKFIVNGDCYYSTFLQN